MIQYMKKSPIIKYDHLRKNLIFFSQSKFFFSLFTDLDVAGWTTSFVPARLGLPTHLVTEPIVPSTTCTHVFYHRRQYKFAKENIHMQTRAGKNKGCPLRPGTEPKPTDFMTHKVGPSLV